MNKLVQTKKLSYRDNVSCIVFKGDKFLLVQQIKWPENFWKFPQGGVNGGETEEQAAKRELLEELGTNKFRFIGKSIQINKYDWDDESVKLAGHRWRGQIQKFFLVECLGDDRDIKLNANELRRYKWVKLKNLFVHIDHNNKNYTNYKSSIEKILQAFNDCFTQNA